MCSKSFPGPEKKTSLPKYNASRRFGTTAISYVAERHQQTPKHIGSIFGYQQLLTEMSIPASTLCHPPTLLSEEMKKQLLACILQRTKERFLEEIQQAKVTMYKNSHLCWITYVHKMNGSTFMKHSWHNSRLTFAWRHGSNRRLAHPVTSSKGNYLLRMTCRHRSGRCFHSEVWDIAIAATTYRGPNSTGDFLHVCRGYWRTDAVDSSRLDSPGGCVTEGMQYSDSVRAQLCGMWEFLKAPRVTEIISEI
ncbi:hypothetical protein EDD18DRAFT_1331987 [Armillaria luteobubalina]|uniref:Uncharacterized protein n=1 Tax=Armillaria luteobubalina TaxID=153913 RepID=A0AA39Q6M0_9AGAR|nr:hypothetical protein EDD18DRAFT_1331987 [Armillaria luteobubalina]